MVKKIVPSQNYTRGVMVSEFRRRMSHYIGQVRYGGDFVAIRRKGEDNVYLISQADWDLVSKEIVDLETGKWDPKLQVRHGGFWTLMNWEHGKSRIEPYVGRLLNYRPGRKTPRAPKPKPDPAPSAAPETDRLPGDKAARTSALLNRARARLKEQ